MFFKHETHEIWEVAGAVGNADYVTSILDAKPSYYFYYYYYYIIFGYCGHKQPALVKVPIRS
jgi:hypothetical protein